MDTRRRVISHRLPMCRRPVPARRRLACLCAAMLSAGALAAAEPGTAGAAPTAAVNAGATLAPAVDQTAAAPAGSKPAGSKPVAARKSIARAHSPATVAQARRDAKPPAANRAKANDDGEAEIPAPVDPSATPLPLAKATELAMQNALPAALAALRVDDADANMRIARSALLPNVTFAVAQSNQTVNLKSQGISLPGLPPLIGPFNSFDARIRLTQSVFNATRLRNREAQTAGLDAAQAQMRATRQQLASATALAYVEALRSARSVDSARANVRLATSLLELARDQRNAGVATGVDVARAESSVAQLEVALAQARTGAEQAQLQLRRLTGLPLGTPLALVDPLRYAGEAGPAPAEAIDYAMAHREEPRALSSVLRQRRLEASATRAEHYPSVDLTADFGASGATPSRDEYGTRAIGLRLTMPLLDGGLTNARVDVADNRAREAELQLRDTVKQVEEDVRLALTTLDMAAQQVRSAEVALELAQRLLHLARDRFASGVADNLEVLDAQTSLVTARTNRVTALGAWNVARINLAGALGRAEEFRF